jgi:hypothetical protein
VEEKTIGGNGHGRDQEAELMVRALLLRGTVEKLAVGGKGMKRKGRKSAKGRGRSSRWLFCHW